MKKILKNYLNSRFKHYYNEGVDVTLCTEYALSDIYEVLCNQTLMTEDLRKWFGKGGAGGTTKGGWDRYGAEGQKLGKCGDGKKGGAYAACLSAEKARKLGKKGRAAFVRRKRAAQKKSGDTKKGGENKKGQKPTYSKTGT